MHSVLDDLCIIWTRKHDVYQVSTRANLEIFLKTWIWYLEYLSLLVFVMSRRFKKCKTGHLKKNFLQYLFKFRLPPNFSYQQKLAWTHRFPVLFPVTGVSPPPIFFPNDRKILFPQIFLCIQFLSELTGFVPGWSNLMFLQVCSWLNNAIPKERTWFKVLECQLCTSQICATFFSVCAFLLVGKD